MALTELGRKAKQAALDAANRHARKTAAPPQEEKDLFEEETPEMGQAAPQAPTQAPEPEISRTEPATTPAPAEPEPESGLPHQIEPPESFEVPEPSGDHSEVEGAISPEAALREHFDATLTDEETLAAAIEFCKDQNLDTSDLAGVEEGYHGWHSGSNFATVTVGTDEYVVAPSEEAADALAVEIVKGMLDDEPELFSQDWLEGHINLERLRSELESDVEEQVRESPESYGWKDEDEDEEDEDGDGNENEEDDEESDGSPSDEWVESKAQEILRDPIDYLRDIYGDETMKHANSIAGIDIDAAAEEAVAADGAGHFLSSYDGETHDLPGGGCYWRS
jgi:hypothetical protein